MGRAKRSGRHSGEAAGGIGGFRCNDADYHRWRTTEVTVGGREIAVVSKPGVPTFGDLDPSEALLLDHLEAGPTDTVCDLHCGSGAVGTLAALSAPGGRVWMTDANLLSVEAARRTLNANGVSNAEVAYGREAEIGHGLRADITSATADIVLIRLPRGNIPILQSLWDAYRVLRPGGHCYLAGGNDEGIRPALRHMEQLFGGAAVLGYRAGHRVGVAVRPDAPAARTGVFDIPWLDGESFHRFQVDARGGPYEVYSRPGVFSWDHLDHGTRALLDVMDVEGARLVLDLGCGSGIVGVAAARLAPAAHVKLVDVNADAVHASRRTVAANGLVERCEVMPGDVAAAVADASVDVLLANPPFHTGRATDLAVPAQFIRDAARVLEPGGRLYLVANRTLPYEAWLRECFGSYSAPRDGREFKVLSATRPA